MTTDELRKALKQAFHLGQTYWQQADSVYTSQWKKADQTRAKFDALVEEACEQIAAPQPRKRLTREEIMDAVCDVDLDWHQGWTLDEGALNRYETLCRAIEAAVWGETE